MTKKQTETLVGLFVLLGMVAIFFLALKAANLATFSFDSTYPLLARFDNVGGLKVGAPVKSAGVTVGRVASIAFDNKSFQGLVTMQIQRQYQFPTDTSAKILTAGLLGDQYLGLEPGGDEKNLQPGDTIKMAQSAIILENLIGQFLYNKAAEAPAKEGSGTK
ncbi:MAG TPA: outer membrane lipid asymmetry maintenance protein MlaD [Burkholderiaceae bacterium]|nr:outer membrane lipid asymmetry maintenance protein MlaD [Burkholderiaceae bacterium]